ncbi:HD-GYP domain-containing protein [Celerinatantimonas sp. YJH-8]|uniref:HD-GYP domain-containing protein n=1 Tax=Celerinatantimonas sp. YJH-8 TaxID=3228714 RepID=UPI0038C7AF40
MADIKLAVDRLRVGIYVKLPIRWDDHPFMFSNFKIHSQDQIDIIRNLGLAYVLVDPSKSDCAPLPPRSEKYSTLPITPPIEEHPPLTKEVMLAKEQQTMTGIERYHFSLKRTQERLDAVLDELDKLYQGNHIENNELEKTGEKLVSSLLGHIDTNASIMIHSIEQATSCSSTTEHSLNVAVLSMLLAKTAARDFNEIKLIGLAGLYHDIGKVLDKDNLRVNKHPQLACEVLVKAGICNQPLATIIMQHHEFLDGSGYPQRLIDEQIHPLAQLLAIANYYDNLCRSNEQKDAKSPLTALALMYRNYRGQLNNDYICLLTRLLGIYPPGSWLKLNSEQFAQVSAVNSDKLLYPCVKVYSENSEQYELIDLGDEQTEYYIDKPIAIDELPESLQKKARHQSHHIYGVDALPKES